MADKITVLAIIFLAIQSTGNDIDIVIDIVQLAIRILSGNRMINFLLT